MEHCIGLTGFRVESWPLSWTVWTPAPIQSSSQGPCHEVPFSVVDFWASRCYLFMWPCSFSLLFCSNIIWSAGSHLISIIIIITNPHKVLTTLGLHFTNEARRPLRTHLQSHSSWHKPCSLGSNSPLQAAHQERDPNLLFTECQSRFNNLVWSRESLIFAARGSCAVCLAFSRCLGQGGSGKEQCPSLSSLTGSFSLPHLLTPLENLPRPMSSGEGAQMGVTKI